MKTVTEKKHPEWLDEYAEFAKVVRVHARDKDHAFIRTTKDVFVWKKVKVDKSYLASNRVIRLLLPADTLVHVAEQSNKCRAEVAISIGIGYSLYQPSVEYSKWEIMVPENKFDRSYGTCASGIHFFFDRKNAKNY